MAAGTIAQGGSRVWAEGDHQVQSTHEAAPRCHDTIAFDFAGCPMLAEIRNTFRGRKTLALLCHHSFAMRVAVEQRLTIAVHL